MFKKPLSVPLGTYVLFKANSSCDILNGARKKVRYDSINNTQLERLIRRPALPHPAVENETNSESRSPAAIKEHIPALYEY